MRSGGAVQVDRVLVAAIERGQDDGAVVSVKGDVAEECGVKYLVNGVTVIYAPFGNAPDLCAVCGRCVLLTKMAKRAVIVAITVDTASSGLAQN